MKKIEESLTALIKWIETEDYKGYDPYDLLSSPAINKFKSNTARFYIQQSGKFFPINLRPLLGVKKEYNPKGLGLISASYMKIYEATGEEENRQKAEKLILMLERLRSPSFKEYAWGYNFPWASRSFYLPAFYPSIVVSSTIGKSLYLHYKLTDSKDSIIKVKSIGRFILNEVNRYETEEHLCFSYTPYDRTRIFNASLMGAELLSHIYKETGDEQLRKTILKAIKYVIENQSEGGAWAYGYSESDKEILQFDFHQGFVIDSLNSISKNIKYEIKDVIDAGRTFYKEKLFYPNGMSIYRFPKKYPVDIHNQAQGVITFSKLKDEEFARKIADWTIDNMQSHDGYFYYQRWPFLINHIPYIRWGQAWMMFALSSLLYDRKVSI